MHCTPGVCCTASSQTAAGATCDVAGNIFDCDLLIQGEAIALGLCPGSIYQNATVCREPSKSQANVLVYSHNLADCGHILKLGCGLALHTCTCTALIGDGPGIARLLRCWATTRHLQQSVQ